MEQNTTSSNTTNTNNGNEISISFTAPKSKMELHHYKALKKKWFSTPREQLKPLPDEKIVKPSFGTEQQLQKSSPHRREIIFLQDTPTTLTNIKDQQSFTKGDPIINSLLDPSKEKNQSSNFFFTLPKSTMSIIEKQQQKSKPQESNAGDGDSILNLLLESTKNSFEAQITSKSKQTFSFGTDKKQPITSNFSFALPKYTNSNTQQQSFTFPSNNNGSNTAFKSSFSFNPQKNPLNEANDKEAEGDPVLNSLLNMNISKDSKQSTPSSFSFAALKSAIGNAQKKQQTLTEGDPMLISLLNTNSSNDNKQSTLSGFSFALPKSTSSDNEKQPQNQQSQKPFPSFSFSSSNSNTTNTTFKSSFSFNQQPNITNTNIFASFNQSATDATFIDYKTKVREFYKKYNPYKSSSDIDALLEKYKGKEDVLLTKLKQKYSSVDIPSSILPPPLPYESPGPTCFMDIAINNKLIGQIHIKLFKEQTPLACENFRQLCTGEAGIMDTHYNKIMHYKNCSFHRIIPGFMMQGGDFTNGDGTGGTSIYKGTEHADMWGKFKDEKPFLSHSRKYLLSMVNNGPNKNGSQFFITLKDKLPHLDGKHVVFGEVVKGMDVLENVVNDIDIDKNKGDKPIQDVIIVDCGEVKNGVCVRPFPFSPVKSK